jgi:hypothetical protein
MKEEISKAAMKSNENGVKAASGEMKSKMKIGVMEAYVKYQRNIDGEANRRRRNEMKKAKKA